MRKGLPEPDNSRPIGAIGAQGEVSVPSARGLHGDSGSIEADPNRFGHHSIPRCKCKANGESLRVTAIGESPLRSLHVARPITHG